MTQCSLPGLRSLLCVVLLAVPPLASSAGVLKPIPQPDLKSVPEAVAKSLTEARKDFDKVRTELVGDPLVEAYLQMAAIYGSNGFPGAAKVAVDNALELDGKNIVGNYYAGILAQMTNDPAGAVAAYKKSVSIGLENPVYFYRYGTALQKLGNLVEAKSQFEILLKATPEHAPTHFALGELALANRKYAEAVHHFQTVLKRFPQATSAYKPLSEALLALGKATEAQVAKSKMGEGKVMASDPFWDGVNKSNAAATSPLSPVLALLQENKWAEAKAAADGAVNKEPNNAEAQFLLALTLEAGSQDGLAQAAYRKAITLDARHVMARIFLANLSTRLKQYELAAQQWREIKKLTDTPEVLGQLIAVDSLRQRCHEAVPIARGSYDANKTNADLAQYFSRAALSCKSAPNDDVSLAGKLASALYQQQPNADHAELAALAAARKGDYAAAVEFQTQALFERAKTGNTEAATRHRTWLKLFEAKQLPSKPWPDGDMWLAPARFTGRAAAPAKS